MEKFSQEDQIRGTSGETWNPPSLTMNEGVTHLSARKRAVALRDEEIPPEHAAGVAAGFGAQAQGEGAAALDGLDDARVDIADPAVGRAEVLADEELDNALDGPQLVGCVQRAEEVALHVPHVGQAFGHARRLDLVEVAAERLLACWPSRCLARLEPRREHRRIRCCGGEEEGRGHAEDGGDVHGCLVYWAFWMSFEKGEGLERDRDNGSLKDRH